MQRGGAEHSVVAARVAAQEGAGRERALAVGQQPLLVEMGFKLALRVDDVVRHGGRAYSTTKEAGGI